MTNEMNFHEWTSCEFYGHQFQDGPRPGEHNCTDCGDRYCDEAQEEHQQ